MRKKIFTALVTIGLTLCMNVTVMADTLQQLQQKKDDAQKQVQQLIKSNETKRKQIDDLEISIQEMDDKIEGLMAEVNKNTNDLTVTQQNLEKAEKDVEAAEGALKDQQELLDKRMRALYINGSNGYLEIILKAKGFTDLISRIETVNKVAAFDKKVIGEIEDNRTDLQQKKQELDNAKAQIVKIKSDNEAKMGNLNSTKNAQKALISKSKSAMADFDKKINYYNSMIVTLNSQIEEKQRQVYSRGTAEFSTNAVVQYAMTFLGTPYQWAANGPNTFDCSGFTKYVFAHFGVDIPRTTYTQIKVGIPISRDNLEPGDLVFFGYGSNVHHVGIYVGNGCYIHAPQTGDVVKISPLTRPDYAGARRVR